MTTGEATALITPRVLIDCFTDHQSWLKFVSGILRLGYLSPPSILAVLRGYRKNSSDIPRTRKVPGAQNPGPDSFAIRSAKSLEGGILFAVKTLSVYSQRAGRRSIPFEYLE
jgi:hypothetical protein